MIRFYLGPNENENMVIQSLYDGCPLEKELAHLEEYQPSDIAVVFGVYKKDIPVSYPRGRIIAKQELRKLDTIILETGYVNRGVGEDKHYAVGFNGLNGRADFKNEGMSGDRAALLPPLKPWREEGEHVLLCGQVPWDASVQHTNHVRWLVETAAVLQMVTKRKIVFRPHPLAKLAPISGCEYSERPLEEDLAKAHVVVTYNSNSGVDAIRAGVPAYAFDLGSMIYKVANKLWTDLERPKMPDREQWYSDLAHCQWLPSEMSEGLTWKHLLR